jgi:integrase
MPRGSTAREPRLILLQQSDRAPVYYIAWHDGQRRQRRTTGTGDRRRADQVFARFLIDKEDEKRGLPSSARYPAEARIADILTAYAKNRAPEINFPERNLYAIKRLLAWWQDRCVDAVRPVICEAYRDARLKQGVKLATAAKELSVLRAALKWAERNGYLVSAPFVKVPARGDGKDRWLTRNEAARLLSAARQEPKSRLHLPLFIMIALYTGARSEAILSLKWFPQVDLARGTIDFNPPGRARTKKGRAIVPIPERLRWFLKKARERATSPYVLNFHGQPIQRIKHSFANACKRAGLEGVTPHSLRHTCGTWLAQQGIDLFQIGGWLGHSDPRTTKLYAHHHPNYLAAAREALDRPRRNIR